MGGVAELPGDGLQEILVAWPRRRRHVQPFADPLRDLSRGLPPHLRVKVEPPAEECLDQRQLFDCQPGDGIGTSHRRRGANR